MASNGDQQLANFYARWHRLESDRRDGAEDIRELKTEMKSGGYRPAQIAGVALAVRRSFESEKAKDKRETAEDVAVALGGFASTPLGIAAIGKIDPRNISVTFAP